MTIRIRIEHGQDAGKTVRLSRPGVYVLGRHTSSSMRVLDMKVSKQHAEVHVVENNGSVQAILRDLGSTHGSQVNGQPVAHDIGLNPGDEIRLGLTILRVLSDGEADEDLAPTGNRDADTASVETRTNGGIDTTAVKELPPDELVGKVLGGYRLEKKIGQGGMGAVYLAEQISLHRKVALKVLSDKFVKDSAFVDQFLNEARAAGALNHPNVVQVYDVGEAEGYYYFSMEFVAHGSIEEKLKSGDDYSWKDALNWFLDSTNALVFARKRDILHRDVKPDNLMLSEDGSAKLCDLGLAKRAENADLMNQGIIGTPHFISPEAIRRKTTVDHRTDLYSLGCTFYRIFAGQNPFPGSTVKEILLGHLKQPVPRVSAHNRDVPKELDDIVFKLMQKDPEERFETADELLVALDKVRVRHGLEAHGIVPKSRKPIIIVAAVAILAAAGIAIWAATREPPPPEIIPRTAQEIEDARKAAITLANQVFAEAELDAERKFGRLKDQLADIRLKGGIDTWKDKAYLPLSEAYDEYATTWRDRLTEWATAREDAEFDEVRERIDVAVSAVEGFISQASDQAGAIRTEVKTRKANEAAEKQAKADGLALAEKNVTEHRDECLAFLAAGAEDAQNYILLKLALRQEVLDDLVKPALDKAVVNGVELLDYEKDMQPLLEKHIKGTKWLAEASKQIISHLRRANLQANTFHIGNKSEATYNQAIARLGEYLETLPEDPDPAGGDISKKIRENRAALKTRIEELEDQRDDLVYGELLKDRDAYFVLIRALRAPKAQPGYSEGLWTTFQFGRALASIAAAKERCKTEAYKPLLDIWARDTAALEGLFTHLKDAFPWDERNVEWVVVRDGKAEKERFRPQLAKLGYLLDKKDEEKADRLDYATVGPRFLLEHVFHDSGENARFAFSLDDKRGLALLSEMAGDMDTAAIYWQAYKVGLEPDAASQSDVMHHMKMLPAERTAAGRWLRILELGAEVRTCLVAIRESKDWRQEMAGREAELMSKIGEIQTIKDELAGDDVAATVFASALREAPAKTVVYAGRQIPEAFIDKVNAKPVRRGGGANKPGGANNGGGADGDDDPDKEK